MDAHRHGSYGYRKDDLRKRLGRIEGQVRGIARMVDEEQYCVDILTQVAAVQAALDRVALGVLRDHVNGCVKESLEGDGGTEHVAELVDVFERFVALRR
ncbi:MAG TPA: metal-sensitive transcriptional regulator [Actinomycetota bacterium]|nr:metal-sensitive transcriptional regulator [Actinomycetota bacterium]